MPPSCVWGWLFLSQIWIDNLLSVIFPDWVSEIHTAQSQWLIRRQRTRISNILSLYFILITTLIHGSKNIRYSFKWQNKSFTWISFIAKWSKPKHQCPHPSGHLPQVLPFFFDAHRQSERELRKLSIIKPLPTLSWGWAVLIFKVLNLLICGWLQVKLWYIITIKSGGCVLWADLQVQSEDKVWIIDLDGLD